MRAASGLAWVGGRLAVILDDANFVALVDPVAPDRARAVALPEGPGGQRQFGDSRGTKHLKLDLEACVATSDPEPLFVAFGSGSTTAREFVVMVEGLPGERPRAALIHRPQLYTALRAASAFAGSELNLEGALLHDGTLRLFGRGNGATRDALRPVNATCDLPWADVVAHLVDPVRAPVPAPTRIAQFALGELGGVPLGFTDAAVWGDTVLFTAAAEASPDAVRDGEVQGSAVGTLGESGTVRWTPLVDTNGEWLRVKAEGVAVADADAGELWVLVDADDEHRPSDLCRVRLGGSWRG